MNNKKSLQTYSIYKCHLSHIQKYKYQVLYFFNLKLYPLLHCYTNSRFSRFRYEGVRTVLGIWIFFRILYYSLKTQLELLIFFFSKKTLRTNTILYYLVPRLIQNCICSQGLFFEKNTKVSLSYSRLVQNLKKKQTPLTVLPLLT